ncbi:MAG: hypothetical protein AAGC95_09925 [Pseudomonadota bacterium]
MRHIVHRRIFTLIAILAAAFNAAMAGPMAAHSVTGAGDRVPELEAQDAVTAFLLSFASLCIPGDSNGEEGREKAPPCAHCKSACAANAGMRTDTGLFVPKDKNRPLPPETVERIAGRITHGASSPRAPPALFSAFS